MLFASGTAIYKLQDVEMKHGDARARCDQDSEDAGVPGFLHLPMPRNAAENEIYYDIISQHDIITGYNDVAWLDIVEVQPPTSPRTWVYKDGSPVTWFNWHSGEPNNYRGGKPNNEPNIQMFSAPANSEAARGTSHKRTGRKWNDRNPANLSLGVCTYFLPAGAENDCAWLHEFED